MTPDFLMMRQELGLLAIFIILLTFDIIAGETRGMRWFRPVAVVLMAVHTALGFVPAPAGEAFGGMYAASPTAAMMKNILNIGTLIVFLQAGAWLRRGEQAIREGEFYIVMLATLLGMYLMVSAGNFMLLYIGLEMASLPMACLAAWNKYREESAEAGAKLILMTALSSGVMMFGLSYLYGATGTLYFAPAVASPMAVLGFVFFFSGLAFKIALVPMHMWAPDVYEGGPTATTAYLSVVSKAAAVFALAISLAKVFAGFEHVWYPMLWGLSVLTIVVGNLFAVRQKNIKRFFAYSSISQAGYILLGLMPGTAMGLTSVVYFIFVYLFSNLAAFGVIAAVENSGRGTDIAAYNGLRRTNPRLAFVMMLAVFSLAGIPPLGGFFSKFFIFAAAASRGEWVLVFIATINTVVSLYYYLRIVRAMFIEAPAPDAAHFRTCPWNSVSLVLCTAGVIVTGLASAIYTYIADIVRFSDIVRF
jgi:NADH-quinone oxidoreductase subunit N